MTIYELQYAYYFSKLGYTTEFFPEKSLFFIKELNAYAKCCSDPALPDIVEKAIEQSKKFNIILLEGNLSFKPYRVFTKNDMPESIGYTAVLVCKDRKYSPYFWDGEMNIDIWPDESNIIATAINGEQFECHRCGTCDDIKISKPSLHYKVTCKCGAYITNVSENKPSALYFGKYKGRSVASMQSKEEIQYLEWGLTQNMFKGKLRRDIEERVKSA